MSKKIKSSQKKEERQTEQNDNNKTIHLVLNRIREWRSASTGFIQKHWMILVPASLIIVSIIVIPFFLLQSPSLRSFSNGKKIIRAIEKNINAQSENSEIPEKYYRRLDGVAVAKGQENLWPVAVMIDNIASNAVRPQVGLSSASLIYEARVEGGITRFMAVYGGMSADQIGPIRSSRHYFLDWALELNALYGHEGGSPESLSAIRKKNILDLHQGRNAQYFWREAGSWSPHNLYSSTELLNRAIRDRGLDVLQPLFESWIFKDDRLLRDRKKGEQWITIGYLKSPKYSAKYQYDREQNQYVRWDDDKPLVDRKKNTPLNVKNVIAQIVPQPTYLASGRGRIDLQVIGEGKAFLFIDGGVNVGTWKKKDENSRTQFYYETGKPVEFNRGPSWITVISDHEEVEYSL